MKKQKKELEERNLRNINLYIKLMKRKISLLNFILYTILLLFSFRSIKE